MSTYNPSPWAVDFKRARIAANFAQRDIADLLGCSQGVVSDIERGLRDATVHEIKLIQAILSETWPQHDADNPGTAIVVAPTGDDLRIAIAVYGPDGGLMFQNAFLTIPHVAPEQTLRGASDADIWDELTRRRNQEKAWAGQPAEVAFAPDFDGLYGDNLNDEVGS